MGAGIDQRTAEQIAAGDAPTAGSVAEYMSPFQQQVIDTTLNEFDRQSQIQQQAIRDQQAQLSVLGAGRAGEQHAKYNTSPAREKTILQAA